MSSRMSYVPVRTPSAMLAIARECLVDAAGAELPSDRYAMAHLGALRAAAAVLAANPVAPTSPRRAARPTSAWVLLPEVAPELTQWAAFFAATAAKRQAAEAGVLTAASAQEADDLLRAADTFLAVVETTVGVSRPAPMLRAV